MLATSVKTSWRHAKRVCRIIGGKIPYFKNKVFVRFCNPHLLIIKAELDVFESLKLRLNAADLTVWLQAKRNKRGNKFFVRRKEPDFFDWDDNEPSSTKDCLTETKGNQKWNSLTKRIAA